MLRAWGQGNKGLVQKNCLRIKWKMLMIGRESKKDEWEERQRKKLQRLLILRVETPVCIVESPSSTGVKIMMITGEFVCYHISWRSCNQWCYEREDCYRTGSRAIEPNLSDDHPVLLQLRLHQGDQVAQFHLITTMMMMSTMIMVRSMMMMKTSSVGKLPLPWMGTTSFISSLNRDTLKSSYVLYCCRLMLTMMKWVIMFFRIMTIIMRIKPVHMIGLRTSGPAKERE